MSTEEIFERINNFEVLTPKEQSTDLESLSREEFLALHQESKAKTKELTDLGKALFAAIDRELLATETKA